MKAQWGESVTGFEAVRERYRRGEKDLCGGGDGKEDGQGRAR